MNQLKYFYLRPSTTFAKPVKCALISISIVIAGITAIVMKNLFARYVADSQAVAAFDWKTSEPRLLGMTADHVISLLGTPFTDGRDERGPGPGHHDPANKFILVYEDTTGEMCRIEITYGRVSCVEHFRE